MACRQDKIAFPPQILKFKASYSEITDTKKCRFMDKRVREISRFFVALPRVFPLSVRTHPRTVLSTNTSSLVQHSSNSPFSRRGC